jgi:hypothetical protein
MGCGSAKKGSRNAEMQSVACRSVGGLQERVAMRRRPVRRGEERMERSKVSAAYISSLHVGLDGPNERNLWPAFR